jgi:hypothetical protein
MDKAERYIVAKQQGLRYKVMYERERTGWTDDQIRRGYRTLKDYVPKIKMNLNILTNGRAVFRVLILEVVAAIINCGEKKPLEFNDFLCACLVYRDLLDMAEMQRG